MAVIYLLENGVSLALVFIAGLWLFYRAQSADWTGRKRAGVTAAAFVVLSIRFLPTLVPATAPYLTFGLDRLGPWLQAESIRLTSGPDGGAMAAMISAGIVLFSIFSLFVPVIAATAYARIRRARREQALLQAALAGQTGSEEFLTLMKNLLDTRFEDVGFHLRYAELLYARGDHRQAAVEARLITIQDPYHFNANLLLANAYYALRLYDDCRKVCDEYLAVAGYCFEFQELRQLCAARDGVT
jgi:hypothetical protein